MLHSLPLSQREQTPLPPPHVSAPAANLFFFQVILFIPFTKSHFSFINRPVMAPPTPTTNCYQWDWILCLQGRRKVLIWTQKCGCVRYSAAVIYRSGAVLEVHELNMKLGEMPWKRGCRRELRSSLCIQMSTQSLLLPSLPLNISIITDWDCKWIKDLTWKIPQLGKKFYF